MLQRLPEAQIEEIIDFLNLTESHRALGTCRCLWELRNVLHKRTSFLRVTCEDASFLVPGRQEMVLDLWTIKGTDLQWSMNKSRWMFFDKLRNLLHLDLGEFATDDFMATIAGGDVDEHDHTAKSDGELLENLQRIDMVRSDRVTDRGLEFLSRGEARYRNLRYVDITYCRHTTYAGTFPLRQRIKNLCVLRRQPRWLDGRFLTPFGEGDTVQIHTYWADGSFSFDRKGGLSSGFVCELLEWDTENPNHVGFKVQYSDFNPPPGWPMWAQFCYRPGVSLLRLQDRPAAPPECNAIRSVLVAQMLSGLRPPVDMPLLDHADVVPLGQSRFLGKDKNLLPDSSSTSERWAMISRIGVEQLPDGKVMPPDDLVWRNRQFCEAMKGSREPFPELNGEELLHTALLRD